MKTVEEIKQFIMKEQNLAMRIIADYVKRKLKEEKYYQQGCHDQCSAILNFIEEAPNEKQ